MNLYAAECSEIILAIRRDDEHVRSLIEQLSGFFKMLFGQRLWIRYYRTFPCVCRFLYYTSTNLFNLQTLGEEYVQLIQVVDQQKRLPVHVVQRICFVILETFGDALVERCWRSASELLLVKYRNCPEQSAWIRLIFSFVELNGVNTLHRAVFLAFKSKYYSISRRVAGISYLSLRPQSNMLISRVLTLIGFSTILQCVALFLLRSARERRLRQLLARRQAAVAAPADTAKSNENGDEEDEEADHICCVCSARKLPVCTPCGHLFCWPCVVDYSVTEWTSGAFVGKCPNCRHNFSLSRVVPLMNY